MQPLEKVMDNEGEDDNIDDGEAPAAQGEEAVEEKTKDEGEPMEVDTEEHSETAGTCTSKHLRKQKPSLGGL